MKRTNKQAKIEGAIREILRRVENGEAIAANLSSPRWRPVDPDGCTAKAAARTVVESYGTYRGR